MGSLLPFWIWIHIPNPYPDPDPADQNQWDQCGSGSATPVIDINYLNPDPNRDPGFWWAKTKIFQLRKVKNFDQKIWSFTGMYMTFKLKDTSSDLKAEHPAIQNMNRLFSCPFALKIQIRIHRPNWVRIQCCSGSEKLFFFPHNFKNRTDVLLVIKSMAPH